MESILAQTCNQYEWIIIDGGSTDGSLDFIKDNASKIQYWVSEPDGGIYSAMNKGIDVSNGDYLLFLNSGDRLASSTILSSFIEKHFCSDIVYGKAIFVDINNNEVCRTDAPNIIRLSDFWGRRGLHHQASFFSKHCFEKYRYNENNRIASDTELFMKLIYNGFSFEKWDTFVDRFEVGGMSYVMKNLGSQEFDAIVNRILPSGIRADYDEFIQNRDVDLYITIRKIIASKRWVRNAARIVLFPFRLFLRNTSH
jgi:glycosyltransferase involved in cell wall biosynthesis